MGKQFEKCPKCGKKGWHQSFGYDPQPERGPLMRCRYCQHHVRTRETEEAEIEDANAEYLAEAGLRKAENGPEEYWSPPTPEEQYSEWIGEEWWLPRPWSS